MRMVRFMMLRIIPARAGFTSVSAGDLGQEGDHPRSRGVYSAGFDTALASSGSSPLARGLLEIAKAIKE